MLIPPPAAAPRTALITGASSAASASIPAWNVRRQPQDGVAHVVARVVHAAQVAADAEDLPAPVRITAPTSLAAARPSAASRSPSDQLEVERVARLGAVEREVARPGRATSTLTRLMAPAPPSRSPRDRRSASAPRRPARARSRAPTTGATCPDAISASSAAAISPITSGRLPMYAPQPAPTTSMLFSSRRLTRTSGIEPPVKPTTIARPVGLAASAGCR